MSLGHVADQVGQTGYMYGPLGEVRGERARDSCRLDREPIPAAGMATGDRFVPDQTESFIVRIC
jgi:hypothetical protein